MTGSDIIDEVRNYCTILYFRRAARWCVLEKHICRTVFWRYSFHVDFVVKIVDLMESSQTSRCIVRPRKTIKKLIRKISRSRNWIETCSLMEYYGVI